MPTTRDRIPGSVLSIAVAAALGACSPVVSARPLVVVDQSAGAACAGLVGTSLASYVARLAASGALSVLSPAPPVTCNSTAADGPSGTARADLSFANGNSIRVSVAEASEASSAIVAVVARLRVGSALGLQAMQRSETALFGEGACGFDWNDRETLRLLSRGPGADLTGAPPLKCHASADLLSDGTMTFYSLRGLLRDRNESQPAPR